MTPNDPYDSCDDDPLPADLVEHWKSFLEFPEPRIAQDWCPGVFDHPVLYPLQRRREFAKMLSMARGLNPAVVMEIGADKGGSIYQWIKCLPTVRRAIACEIRGVPYANLFRSAFPQVDFMALPESSLLEANRDKIADFLGDDPIDCLFIDGCKACVDRDFTFYAPMVRPGGLVFIHDVNPDADAHEPAPAARFFQRIEPNDKGIVVDVSELDDPAEDTAYGRWLRFWGKSSCGFGWVRVV